MEFVMPATPFIRVVITKTGLARLHHNCTCKVSITSPSLIHVGDNPEIARKAAEDITGDAAKVINCARPKPLDTEPQPELAVEGEEDVQGSLFADEPADTEPKEEAEADPDAGRLSLEEAQEDALLTALMEGMSWPWAFEPQADEEPEEEQPEAKPAGPVSAEKRQKMLAKIEALLAKAANEATTQEEAELFAAKAAELMARYEVDSGELAGGERGSIEIGEWVYRVTNSDNAGAQRKIAVLHIAKAMGGAMFYSAVKPNGRDIYFHDCHVFAPETVLESLKLILTMSMNQMESLLRQAAIDHRTKLRGKMPEDKAFWRANNEFRRGYILGFGEGVGEKIKTMRGAVLDEAMGSGSAEIVLMSDHERADAEMRQRYNLKSGGKTRRVSAAGYEAGKNAGRTAVIAGQGEMGGRGRAAVNA
ncbi:DUF2786 domain-containing protein [Streptomyces spororaveus]|uniref:DUF2786 domain-containing protein n=1 Tax=Streptomyces spororaveus TaxID=284039 RepID=UPI003796606D